MKPEFKKAPLSMEPQFRMVRKADRLRFRERARKALREIPIAPTLLTLGNFFCGFLAICYVVDSFQSAIPMRDSRLSSAAWLIFLGMIFDLFDGKVARLTNQESEFGAQMDSMADVVTFGIAPAMLVKAIVNTFLPSFSLELSFLIGAFYAGCAALRLARFNVETDLDPDSHKVFKGLPSPAAAGCLASLSILYLFKVHENKALMFFLPPVSVPLAAGPLIQKIFVMGLMGFTVLTAILMVSRIRYPHFGHYLFRGPRSFYILPLILMAFVIFMILPDIMLAVICCGYALFGLLGVIIRKLAKPKVPAVAVSGPGHPVKPEEDEDEIF